MIRAGTVLSATGTALIAASLLLGIVLWRAGGDGRIDVSAGLLDPAGSARLNSVTDQVIEFFQSRVERDPVDSISYTKIGEGYVRQARETGDISAYERAETALRKALELSPGDPEAASALATVLFAKHDFAGALALAEQVYAADPGATQALATIGDARLELGDYEGARDAYAFLANAAGGPPVLSRQAHLAELLGDQEGAIDLMEQAAREAALRGRSAEGLAWYRVQAGVLHFHRGRADDAERWHAAALEAFPGYPAALAGLADVAASRGDLDQAIGLYERAVAAVPTPAHLATLGDLYARAGDRQAAQRQYETVEFIGRLAAINRAVYNRELALFYADHAINTDRAVELALAELALRKDIYGYDAAAWALYRAGRVAEAAPLMEQALRLGTQDARLLFHAGLIARATGDDDRARALLAEALEINPHFSVLFQDEARETLSSLRRAGE